MGFNFDCFFFFWRPRQKDEFTREDVGWDGNSRVVYVTRGPRSYSKNNCILLTNLSTEESGGN